MASRLIMSLPEEVRVLLFKKLGDEQLFEIFEKLQVAEADLLADLKEVVLKTLKVA